MVACAQCRQRKVRCEGGPVSCDACKRLGFQCSLGLATTPIADVGNLPVASRKRGTRACDACRSQRSRCTGETPSCRRCRELNIPCNYTLSVRQYRAGERHKRSLVSAEQVINQSGGDDVGRAMHGTPTTGSEVTASPDTSSTEHIDKILGCDRAVIRQHIDAYYDYIYPVPIFSFLHRAEFLGQYTAGIVSPALLLAVCGVSSRFLSSARERAGMIKSWIEQAETIIFQNMGKMNVSDVQALMLLELHCMYNHQNGKSFTYISLAVRMAYLLKLHKEDRQLPFVEQESRRRLLWCMFALDRLHAGGVPEYILLPATSVHVQLPCPEHFFQIDTPVATPHIHETQADNSKLTPAAFLLRIFNTRNHVLQYTKQLLDASLSPETSLAQFQMLEGELREIHESLPAALVFSTRAYQLRTFSPERTTFTILHLYFHHCHCELYRLLNPGYREALPQSVIYSSSPELVAYAQSKCLEHAISIGEIVASTYGLVEISPYVSDTSCFVILYQASCAILYACHRDSPAYVMKPETARRYLVAFIATLQSLLSYFPRYAIYVKDIRNMLRSIDEPNVPLPAQKASNEVDFRARIVPSEENSDEDNLVSEIAGSTSNLRDDTAHSTSQTAEVPVGPLPELVETSLHTPSTLEEQDHLFADLETSQYNMDLAMDLDQGLLWDWADALESGFSI
ncbi:fungal-specific transcription factor domain-containing protein [Alternaria rosae]|uniref:fungal-specific transcription factor domain-containing protein n=1 Tax=Alternaria rosae TaxID=1187941 RepID=UPI001E8D672D|nr:fungal-specific transcription factor domain-containing protein [Alternaria rosae]KAH6870652.1 fungal-specific transcription factor domain-containing protein [Alternaria rosae]